MSFVPPRRLVGAARRAGRLRPRRSRRHERDLRQRPTAPRWTSRSCPSTTSTGTSSRRPAPAAGSSSATTSTRRRRVRSTSRTDRPTPRGSAASSTSPPTSSRPARATPNSLTVAAGDLIGASPLLSAAFHDEPTIEAMNTLGLDVSAVGNHEFDEGYKELQRMAVRRLHRRRSTARTTRTPCPTHKFKGADFDYLAANVKYAGTNKTILPAYTVKNDQGRRQDRLHRHDAEGHPVDRHRVRRRRPRVHRRGGDRQRVVPVLQKQGVNAIVVLIHQGGAPGQQTWFGPDNKPYTVNPVLRRGLCAKGAQLDPTSPDHPDRQGARPGDRHGHLRPHAPALRLRHQGPGRPAAAGDVGVVVRPAVHRDQPHLRHAHPGHRPRIGQGRQHARHPRRAPRTRRRRP